MTGVEKPAVRHATSRDGTRIAFWSAGSGPPLLYIGVPCCSHVQLEIEKRPRLAEWYAELSARLQLVRLDLRGYGASERDGVELSIDRFEEDILAVADALALRKFSLFAQGGSAPAAISLAASSPRVERLIVFDGWADGVHLPVHQNMNAALALARFNFETFSEFVARVVLRTPQRVAATVAELVRQSATTAEWERFSEFVCTVDVTGRLRQIACPTLVVHSGPGMHTGDGEESLAISRAIPTAELASFELLSFPLGDHSPVLEAIFALFAAAKPGPDAAKLSEREREVLELLTGGRTNRQIAQHLVISEPTVARHVHNVLTKLGFSNRVEAATWAAGRRR